MLYRLLVDLEVFEFLDRLPRRLRKPLRQAIASIGNDPHGNSEAVDRDQTGRRLEIKVVGEYAVTYWIDEADRHIKILDIHGADR